MSNPLYQSLGGGAPSMPGPLGNFSSMMQQLNQFCSTFRGDPKAEVERMLRSGEMTQSQFNQLQGVASQIMQLMPK